MNFEKLRAREQQFKPLGLERRKPTPKETAVDEAAAEPDPEKKDGLHGREGANGGQEIQAAPPDPGDEKRKAEELAYLEGVLKAHRRRLLSLPGVTAVDIGYKIENGKFTNDLAIRLHVERKIDRKVEKKVLAQRPELGSQRIAKLLKGVCSRGQTDVIQAIYGPNSRNPHLLLKDPKSSLELNQELGPLSRSRVNPLAGGISIGGPFSSGTLGALVWDRTDGRVCILSNWHVLAGRADATVGTPCFQPGLFDQGLGGDVIARLKRWSFGRRTDAALAELDTNRRYCPGEILAFPGAIGDAVEPALGMVVFKMGRSTGFTAGFIDGIHFTSTLTFGNGIVQQFEKQIHIAPLPHDEQLTEPEQLSEPGDSGAVWVTLDPKLGLVAVGLHFSGDLANLSFGEFALANSMVEVQERLKFSFRPLFVDESEPTSDPVPLQPSFVTVPSFTGFSSSVGALTGGSGLGPQTVSVVRDPP